MVRGVSLLLVVVAGSFVACSAGTGATAPADEDAGGVGVGTVVGSGEDDGQQDDDPADAAVTARDGGSKRDGGAKDAGKGDAASLDASAGDAGSTDASVTDANASDGSVQDPIIATCTPVDPNDFWAGYNYARPGMATEHATVCYCNEGVMPVAKSGFGAGSTIPYDLKACSSCTMTAAGSVCRGPRVIAPGSTASVPACHGAGRLDGNVAGSAHAVQATIAGYSNATGVNVYFFEDDALISAWPEAAKDGDRRFHLVLGALSGPTRIWAEMGLYKYESGSWTLVEKANQALADVTSYNGAGGTSQSACYGRVAGTIVASFSTGSIVGAFDAPLLGPAF